MKDRDQHTLAQRYADLLNEQDDVTSKEVIASLDHIYTAHKRGATVSWSMLKARYDQSQGEKQAAFPHSLFRPVHRISLRLSIVVIVLLVVLLTIGTVYAQINGLLQDIINLDPGASQLQQSNQLVSTNGTQTLHGFTITMQKAYADNNRVIIAYIIQNPKDIKDLSFSSFYQDVMYYQQPDGQFLPLTVLGGVGPYSPDAPAYGMVTSFDTSCIEGNPATLHLKYVIKSIEYTQFINQTNVQHFVQGPFTFALSVPFHTGKTFTVGQSQSSRDGTITLDKVRVSPSEVRIYTHSTHWRNGVGFSLTMSTSKNVPGVSYLTVSNDTHHYLMYGRPDNADGSMFSILIPADLINKPGPWTVHLLFSSMKQPGKVLYTMTFRFDVPK